VLNLLLILTDMKKLILLLLIYHTISCSSNKVNDEETICTDSQLGVNCPNADYIKNFDSPYVLPWEIGKTFKVGQGNCTDGSHSLGQVQYAYDIDMPIGTNIVAMRSGTVVKVIENFKDLETGTVGAIDEANVINIKHADGTEAQYVHLTQNGALKNEGDNVTQGEIIALSGNTGKSTGPHLHFHVLQALNECEDTDPRENYTWYSCNSIPLTFKNTSVHCHGLLERNLMSEGYTAESY
jgi:murein DD-endopeptidase MepM/ murein hydrolase activator NlpD